MTRASSKRSAIAHSDEHRIVVMGHDLAGELIGKIDLGDMAFLELKGRLPTAKESRMFNALLVTLVEHGMTPSVIATRLTYYGAPESLQGAVAAGLLGLGTRFVGTIEGAARLLQESFVPESSAQTDIDAIASRIVRDHRERGIPIPGLGHPLHTGGDPRTATLFALAEELDFSGKYVALEKAIAREAETVLARRLPVNATGAIGAIASELGFEWSITRGFAVISRSIGLVAHLLEERARPLAPDVWRSAEALADAEDR